MLLVVLLYGRSYPLSGINIVTVQSLDLNNNPRQHFVNNETITFVVKYIRDTTGIQTSFSFEIVDPQGKIVLTRNQSVTDQSNLTSEFKLEPISIFQFYTIPGKYRFKTTDTSTHFLEFNIYEGNNLILHQPANGMELESIESLFFSWQSVGATKYRITILGPEKQYNNPVLKEEVYVNQFRYPYPPDPTLPRQHLVADENYYWQVEPLDDKGQLIGKASELYKFKVKKTVNISEIEKIKRFVGESRQRDREEQKPVVWSLSGGLNVTYQNEINQGSNFNFNGYIDHLSRGKNSATVSTNLGQGWQSVVVGHHSKYVDTTVGTINPYFSELTIYGLNLNGGMVDVHYKKVGTFIIAGQSNPTQFVYGLCPVINLSEKTKFGLVYYNLFNVEDTIGSLINRPLSLTNIVYGGNLVTLLSPGLNFGFEFARDSYDYDTKDNLAPEQDFAYQGKLGFDKEMWGISLSYKTIGEKFVSLASPMLVQDRSGCYGTIYRQITKNIKTEFNYAQYRNNLNNRNDKITTLTNNVTLGTNLQFEKLPYLQINCSYSTDKGNILSIVNNRTDSIGFQSGKQFNNYYLYAGINFVQFQDHNSNNNSFFRNEYNLYLNTVLFKLFNISSGIYLIETKHSSYLEQMLSPNINLVFVAKPDKYNVSLYTGLINEYSSLFPKDKCKISTAIRGTYFLNRNLGVTAGYEIRNTVDPVISVNKTESIWLVGLNLLFSVNR